MQFPRIKSTRLLLDEIRPEDGASIYKLFSDESVVRYYDLAAFTEIEQALELIKLFKSRYKSKLGIRWAIRLKGSGQLIGTCGFNSWNQKMQNTVIGYDVMPEYWGQGYAIEAVEKIVMAAFDGSLACGPVNRIQADTVPGNNASEALLRKLGFKFEGMRRESGYWKGKFHDLNCYSLLRSEFKAEQCTELGPKYAPQSVIERVYFVTSSINGR
jgi:[ribosomal protein S5]-alanine N-acetyltransferase